MMTDISPQAALDSNPVRLDGRRPIDTSDLHENVRGPVAIPESSRRTYRIQVVCTAAEGAELEAMAARYGLPVATFCYKLIMRAKGAVK